MIKGMKRFIACAAVLACSNAPSWAGETKYGYDALGRLSVVEDAVSSTTVRTSLYTLDTAGNRSRVIGVATNQEELIVFRFHENSAHFYTTGYMEGYGASFVPEGPSFKLFRNSLLGRSPIYRCRAGYDYFLSLSSNCEGVTFEHQIGQIANSPGAGLIALHRFYKSSDHVITTNYAEGVNAGYVYEGVLGYVPQ